MTNQIKVITLGCGSSAGVPCVEAGWGQCDSNESKNKRTRASIFLKIEHQGTLSNILIDTSPDLRYQFLREEIKHLDAVLYTHLHADHIHGLNDLRSINRLKKGPIDCWGDDFTMKHLDNCFGYAFKHREPSKHISSPWLIKKIFEYNKAIHINNINIMPFKQNHGQIFSTGFKIGSFVYSTDVIDFPEESKQHLYNLDSWVIGTLSLKLSHSHANLEKVISWYDKFKPKTLYLTHLGLEMDYQTLIKQLPSNIIPLYDGMKFIVNI